ICAIFTNCLWIWLVFISQHICLLLNKKQDAASNAQNNQVFECWLLTSIGLDVNAKLDTSTEQHDVVTPDRLTQHGACCAEESKKKVDDASVLLECDKNKEG
ncbi:hypothetical protein ACJX0J_016692, partial [Zea mays]